MRRLVLDVEEELSEPDPEPSWPELFGGGLERLNGSFHIDAGGPEARAGISVREDCDGVARSGLDVAEVEVEEVVTGEVDRGSSIGRLPGMSVSAEPEREPNGDDSCERVAVGSSSGGVVALGVSAPTTVCFSVAGGVEAVT